jgi:hypothetical protein
MGHSSSATPREAALCRLEQVETGHRAQTDDHGDEQDGPDVMLWAALVVAPPEGTTVPDLMTATGMSRPRIYLRLRDLAEQGHVIQVGRGRWRAVTGDTE